MIDHAAIKENLFIKQAEVHGMSQRGGDVQSHLRISSEPIASDLIPRGGADLVLSLEPMEALRYLPFLAPDGWIVTNTVPFKNIPNYPDEAGIIAELGARKNVILLDVDEIARQAGSPCSSNIALLGACSALLDIAPAELEAGISEIFARKGEKILEANLAACRAGAAAAR